MDDISAENIEETVNIEYLQSILDKSEDLELRKTIRARIRQLKKDNVPSSNHPASKKNHQPIQSYLNTDRGSTKNLAITVTTSTVTASIVVPSNVVPKLFLPPASSASDENGESEKALSDIRRQLSSYRSAMDNNDRSNNEPISKANEMEKVRLRPVTENRTGKNPAPEKTGEVALKKGSSLTAKEALKKFKEMDDGNFGKRECKDGDSSSLLNLPTDRNRFSKFRSSSPNTIKEQTLHFCRNRLNFYQNVNIEDFSTSWNDGLAFCALANSFFPAAFDYDSLTAEDKRHNFSLAFETLEKYGDVAPLLEASDMAVTENPDWRCVFTYVNSVISTLLSADRRKSMVAGNE